MKTTITSFRGMNQGYVYYKSFLKHEWINPDSKTQQLIDNAKSANIAMIGLSNTKRQEEILLNIGNELKIMADHEEIKERNFLSNAFGIDFKDVNIFSNPKSFEANLVEAFNMTLQLEDILTRFVSRYNYKNTKTTDFENFGIYLNQAWEEHSSKMADLLDINQSVAYNQQILANYIQNIVIPDGISKFLSISSNIDPKNNNNLNEGSYQILLNYFETLKTKGTHNPIIDKIYKFYNFENISNSLADLFINTGNIDIKNNARNLNTWNLTHQVKNKNVIEYSGHNAIQGGTIAEIFYESILNMIGDLKLNIYNDDLITIKGKIQVVHTGPRLMRPDIMMTYGVKSKALQDTLNNLGSGVNSNRESMVKEFKKMANLEGRLKQGYIIHNNIKDYGKSTYRNKNSRDKLTGFQGGSMTLEQYREITKSLHNNSQDLIGAIAQTLKGAVGEQNRDFLTEVVAADISYFLFDDISNLGKDMTQLSGIRGNNIYLFTLSGFYVPLSVLLHRLGNAFINFANDSATIGQKHSLVDTKISAPSISYSNKEKEELNNKPQTWTTEEWETQRIDALTKIKISARFLKSLDDILKPAFNL